MIEALNYNIATISNYKLEIAMAPELNYFIQSTELPNITLPEVYTPYKDNNAYMPGDTIDYDPLNVNFIVDEDYKNFIYIQDWIRSCRTSRELPFKDITLHILNNNKLKNKKVVFYSAFPTMLGNITFDSSENDTIPILCSTIFRYQYYEFVI
jgi:hypothetical protein